MGHDFKISTRICRWKVRDKEGGKEGKRGGGGGKERIVRRQSKGSEVKVEGGR